MKLIQYDSWILTVWKKIIYQPLESQLSFDELSQKIDKNFDNIKRIESYARYQLVKLLDRVEMIHKWEYALSWFSKTSAYTKSAHTHFRKDPDQIHREWKETMIDTKRLLNVWSAWYTNDSYDIKRLVKIKNELVNVLSKKK
jgi:hypothetical protein